MNRVGQRLGNYRLVRFIGQGAFAEVYLGEHIHLGSQAAIKVLRASVSTPDQTEQFLAEARKMARLIHPHIVRVLDFGTEEGAPFLVLDYAQGGTLRQRHPRGIRLPPPTIVTYVRQIADGLDYAHHKKLIHRDIKPDNLLLNQREEVLISDFGIAVMASTNQLSIQNIAGTVFYMAPEQLEGEPERASDQYAVGIVVYEWLTGALPFSGSWMEVATQHRLIPPPPLRRHVPTLSPAVEEVVLTALAKNPKDRFTSVQTFAHVLAEALEEELKTPADSITALKSNMGLLPASPEQLIVAIDDSLATNKEVIPPPAQKISSDFTIKVRPSPSASVIDGNNQASSLTEQSPSPHPSSPRRYRLTAILSVLVLIALLGGALGGLSIARKGPFARQAARPTTSGPTAGKVTEFPLLRPNSEPSGITTGPDGNLWFTEVVGAHLMGQIGRITPKGTITEFPLLNTSYEEVTTITAGLDGNLWFNEYNANRIGRITPTGVIQEFPVPMPKGHPAGVARGPDGNLWFTEFAANQIGRITPTGTIQEFPVPTKQSEPFEITTGPDGNLWFTEFAANQIGRITPAGTLQEFPIPTAQSGPDRIVTGPDGNLWFTEYNANQIGCITPAGIVKEFLIPTHKSYPTGITSGPNGSLWFTERDGNQIGQITSGGIITEFRLPTANGQPVEITTGPDKNLWFTEDLGNQIGYITSGR